MRKIIFIIMVSLGQTSIDSCQSVSTDSIDKKQIVELEQELSAAVTAGDKKAFDKLTHKNYVERFDHTEYTKTSILNELQAHPETKFEYSISNVDIYESAAVVRGVGIYTTDTTSNKKIYYMFSDVFVKDMSTWKLANSHASSVPSWIAVTPRDNELVDLEKMANCEEEAKVKSSSYDQPAFIRFKNTGTPPINIEWINYDGKRNLRKLVEPGKSYDQKTFLTHPFIITGAGEKCYGIYVPEKKPGLVTIN